MTGIDRTQYLRIDCPSCRGKGYVQTATGEESCGKCDGSGLLEKEVPFKFESNGKWDREDIAEVFEIPVEQVVDKGHDGGDAQVQSQDTDTTE